MQVVILAGGFGTRLRPATDAIPKALVPVKGKPFLEHQLVWLASYGFQDILLCIGYRAEQIVAFAGDGSAFGVRITYAYEREALLGTAGALKQAEALLASRFCVLNGDSYLPIDPREPVRSFEAQAALAMMLVFRNHGRYDESNTAVHDGFVTAYRRDNPQGLECIDYGFRMFRREVLTCIPPQAFCDLSTLYHRLIARRQLSAYVVREPFYEIGSRRGLARFARYLEAPHPAQR